MKIHIFDISTDTGETRVVKFTCSAGKGIARWNSQSLTPIVSEAYNVEIDIDESIEKGNNAFLSTSDSYSLASNPTTTNINGVVDGVDDYDGLVYLRLADDCLIMIEGKLDDNKQGEWISLTINTDSLSVTPIGG